ncbi:hypothetical protein KEM55_000226 [Ascosphaera atra]|nr:hypothetical protein KEM55_000226 [Ascosphaera atra]
MPALIVPREGEELHRDADDMYTVSGRPDLRPSADLEECLMARMLREAKERWNAREWGYERVRRPTRKGGGASDAEGSQTEASQPSEAAKEYETDTDFYTDQEGAENMSDDSQSRRRRKVRADDPVKLRPAIQTDDEKSYKILRPSARHILSRLDDLLLALHKARAAYMNYDEDGSSKRQRPEPKGKKRKHGKGRTSNADERNGAGEPDSDSSDDGKRKKGRRGDEGNAEDAEHRPRKRRARSRSAQQKSMSLHDEEFKPASDSEDENFTPTSSSSPSHSESGPEDPAPEKSTQKVKKKGKDRQKPHNDVNNDGDSDDTTSPAPHDYPKIPPLQRRNERLFTSPLSPFVQTIYPSHF